MKMISSILFFVLLFAEYSCVEGQKIALLTFGTPQFFGKWKDSISIRNCYAARYGYQSIIEVLPEVGNNAHWHKPYFIESYLPFYDWIFYFDLDILILNHSLPLDHFISSGSHVIISDEFEAPTLAGMIAIRNSEIGRSFLSLWKSFKGLTTDYDNGGLIASVLTYVAKKQGTVDQANHVEQCLGIFRKEWSYINFEKCYHSCLSEIIGSYAQRNFETITFLPPNKAWNKFSQADFTARKSYPTRQSHPDRLYKKGDFLVHVKYSSTSELNDFYESLESPCRLLNKEDGNIFQDGGRANIVDKTRHVVQVRKSKNKLLTMSSSVAQRQVDGIVWKQVIALSPQTNRIELFRELYTNKYILHVGCTDWPFTKDKNNLLHYQLSLFVKSLDCLDTDLLGLDHMRTMVQGNYYSDPSDALDQVYDAVIVPETIEHVPGVAEFVQSLEKLQFKEIFISCPNIATNPKYPWHFHRINATHFEENIHPDHKMWGSPYTLVNIVEQYTDLIVKNVWLLENNLQTAIRAIKNA